FGDELGGDLAGETAYLVERTGTVRIAAGITDVDQMLPREQVDERPGHGETAENAVEHADRPIIHCRHPLPGEPSGQPGGPRMIHLGGHQATVPTFGAAR